MDEIKERKPPQEWTAEEDKLLIEGRGMYGEGHWLQVADHVKTKTAHQCLQRWTLTLNPDIIKGRFSKEEDELLKKIVETNGPENWSKIAENIPGRTRKQCLERWTRSLNPDIIKGPFSGEEDKLLAEAVKRCGTKNWRLIASYIPGRTAKQCCNRWNRSLDPNLSKGLFTHDEDQIIIEKYGEYGPQWAKIAKHLPGRTDVQVRYRFNNCLKKRLTGENSKMVLMKNRQAELERRQKLQQDIVQQPKPWPIPQLKAQTNKTIEETSIFGIDFSLFSELENQLTNMPFSNPTDTNRKVKVSAGSNETYQNIANASEEFEQKTETNKNQEKFLY